MSKIQQVQKDYDMIRYGQEDVYLATSIECRVMETLLDKKNFGTSTDEKIRRSGLNKQTWYRTTRKPRFKEMITALLWERWVPMAEQMLQKTFENGMEDKKCVTDRTNFLKFMGLINEKKDVNINKHSESVNINMNKMTDKQLKTFIREKLKSDPAYLEAKEDESEETERDIIESGDYEVSEEQEDIDE
jgi:hypothetical protein